MTGRTCQCSRPWGICARPAVARRYIATRGRGGQWRNICAGCARLLLARNPRAKLVALPGASTAMLANLATDKPAVGQS